VKKAVLFIFVLLVLGAAAAGGYFWVREQRLREFTRTSFGDPSTRVVEIPQGTGPHALATLLASERVVSDADEFYQLVRHDNAGPKLKAGEYDFKGALTPAQVLARIVAGQVKTYHFTIPEGLRVDEILPMLASSDLKLDGVKLESLSRDPAFLRKANVPAGSLEGFLFPDTYTFTRGYTEESVLLKMVSRTFEEYRKADLTRKAGVTLSTLEAITLASIVEKETAATEERPRISCVFHNRLRRDMRLDTDPTVLYAMMLIRGHFIKNLTRQDLETPHPYNTYKNKGLPPGPIANPGAAAIQAALNPIDCDDLFFVSRNDGTHVFCPDLRCHEAAVQKWQVDFFHGGSHPAATPTRAAATHGGHRRK